MKEKGDPKTRYLKTTIMVEVLRTSHDVGIDGLSLREIAEQGYDGDYSLEWHITKDAELTPKQMVKALKRQGSDPQFLGLDK